MRKAATQAGHVCELLLQLDGRHILTAPCACTQRQSLSTFLHGTVL